MYVQCMYIWTADTEDEWTIIHSWKLKFCKYVLKYESIPFNLNLFENLLPFTWTSMPFRVKENVNLYFNSSF